MTISLNARLCFHFEIAAVSYAASSKLQRSGAMRCYSAEMVEEMEFLIATRETKKISVD